MARKGIKVELVEKDHGYNRFTDLIASIRRSADSLRVGVIDGKGGDSPRNGSMTNASLAAIHEFGSANGHIPERSFLRSTMAANEQKYVTNLVTLFRKILDGEMDQSKALNILGARISSDVKNKITSGEGIPPPNAPSTIARKKSNRPLVDTGRLLSSITWVVDKK